MQQDAPVSDFFDIDDVCRLIRRSRKSLWLMRREGGFPAPLRLRPRSRPLWPRQTVLAWLAAQQTTNAEGGV